MRNDVFNCALYTNPAADECDRSFVVDDNSNNYVVWAFGELGETAFKHSDFSRAMSKHYYLYIYILLHACSVPMCPFNFIDLKFGGVTIVVA